MGSPVITAAAAANQYKLINPWLASPAPPDLISPRLVHRCPTSLTLEYSSRSRDRPHLILSHKGISRVFILTRCMNDARMSSTNDDEVPKHAAADQKLEEEEEMEISAGASASTSILSESWIDRFLPTSVRNYARLARLDKPIGIWLLWWPTMWSIALAAPSTSHLDYRLLTLTGVGSILIRGAACTINDIFDQDFDRKVQRTMTRPIASGRVTTSQALAFLALQLLLLEGIGLQLNTFSQVLGAIDLILLGMYPLMKRWTYWPQAFLGVAFNWGILLGWASIKESIDPYRVLPLFISAICWTIVLDTIYAHQDKEDDAKIGVKSTALYFGNQTKPWLWGFGCVCASLLCLTGYTNNLGLLFYLGTSGAIGHLVWQILTVDLSNPNDCKLKFISNKWYGAIVFASIIMGKVA